MLLLAVLVAVFGSTCAVQPLYGAQVRLALSGAAGLLLFATVGAVGVLSFASAYPLALLCGFAATWRLMRWHPKGSSGCASHQPGISPAALVVVAPLLWQLLRSVQCAPADPVMEGCEDVAASTLLERIATPAEALLGLDMGLWAAVAMVV